MVEEFPELPYAYDFLEPYIDKQTMMIHHDKHHKGYYDKLLETVKDYPELRDKSVKEILENLDNVSDEIKQSVINFGGGFFHHSFFWQILKKNVMFNNNSDIGREIIEKFGDIDRFREQFSNSASSLFGSGWTWLVLDKASKQLEIIQTKNQDSPLSIEKIPLLTIDVWEHAYYLKYQNRRADYIKNFFNVINWEKVNDFFVKAREEVLA